MNWNDWDKYKQSVTPLDIQDKAVTDPPAPPITVMPKGHLDLPYMNATVKTHDFDPSIYKQIKKGKRPVQFRLDLHGMTQDQAYNALTKCITQNYHNQKRTGIIITGKGTGVLKNVCPGWLRQNPYVHSFTTASIEHGGFGALYVKLKKK